MVVRRGQDLYDIAVLQLRAQGHQLPVDPAPDAAMADFGVYRIGEIDWRGAARERLDLSLRRKAVDLVGIESTLTMLRIRAGP